MKILKRFLFFLIVFVFTFGAGLGLFRHLGIFQLNGIPIEVVSNVETSVMRNSPGASADLKARLTERLKIFDHHKIWEVSLGQIQAAVMQDGWVKEVRISRALPNQIRVLVKSETPVGVWIPQADANEGLELDKQNRMIPVAEDGRLLSALTADNLPDVPVLRGARIGNDEAFRQKLIQFVLSLPAQGALSRGNLSEVSWTPEEGFVLTLNDPHITVKLGDEQLDLKVMRVSQVFEYLSINHLRGRVIDASFSKKVLVRLRKAP